MRERPRGGYCFEAVKVQPEGWLCLAPWVQNEDGYWWRPHIESAPHAGEEGRLWAEHYARQINVAMGILDAEP